MIKTIKGKIVIYFTLAFTVLIMVFLGFFYVTSYRAQREKALTKGKDNLEYFQSSVNRMLERCVNLSDNIYFNRNITKVLVRNYDLADGSNLDKDLSVAIDDISTYLKYDIISKYATSIIVHGNNGKTIRYGVDADYFAISGFEEEAWFKDNRANLSGKWLPMIESKYPSTLYRYYLPLLREEISLDNYRLVGWQMIAVSTDIIKDEVSDYNFDDDDVLLVYDSARQCIYCNRSDFDADEYEPVLAKAENASNDYVISVGGKKWFAAINHSDYSALTMVYLADYSSFRHEFDSLLESITALFISLMVIAVIMTLILSNILTKPILRIIQAMVQISGGNFSTDTSLEGDDEIGKMGAAVNSLADNMAEMVERVREEERSKKELEYRILQNQINPHFVYNVLNSVKVMAQLQGADNICKLIDSFGGLLKEVSKGVNDRVTVREEFELAEKFVFIHKLRRKGLIESNYEIEEGCENCLVIKFLLQPLLENAIIHGFEGKRGMGELHVSAKKKDDKLELSILDNGTGMSGSEIEDLLSGRTDRGGKYNSIGVKNVQERIRMIYGEEYGINYSSVEGEYTRVTVLLPLEYQEERKEHV